LERRLAGVMNVTGPEEPLSFGELLDACREVTGSDATITWADPTFLLETGVEPWSELPLWLPGDENAGFHRRRFDRALAAGLELRPIAETVRDTLAWDRERGLPELVAGLSRDREGEVLASWHASAA
jgi:nucleoside-diphosphate-sugar epimerase